MNHDILKSVIFDQHEIIKNFIIYPREYSFEENANYVLTGMRRSGKSTLLYDIVQKLIAAGNDWNQIVYINFEDERLADFTINDFNDILGVAYELSDSKSYFFFDEIQNIDGKNLPGALQMQKREYILPAVMQKCSAEILKAHWAQDF